MAETTRAFLGRGWRFPVQIDAEGRIALSSDEQDVREAVRLILLTGRGERVMRPEFGAGLHDYVFEVMSSTTLGSLQAEIERSLVRWEPRIEVLKVAVRPDAGRTGTLLADIDYRVRSTNTRFNVVFPFYREDG